MKIKSDFITNSSSASFILAVKSIDDCSLSEFEDKFGKFMDWFKTYKSTSIVRFWDGIQIREGDTKNVFLIEAWTTMYNDDDDIPEYMRYICMDENIENRHKSFGFEFISFEIDED